MLFWSALECKSHILHQGYPACTETVNVPSMTPGILSKLWQYCGDRMLPISIVAFGLAAESGKALAGGLDRPTKLSPRREEFDCWRISKVMVEKWMQQRYTGEALVTTIAGQRQRYI